MALLDGKSEKNENLVVSLSVNSENIKEIFGLVRTKCPEDQFNYSLSVFKKETRLDAAAKLEKALKGLGSATNTTPPSATDF